MDKSKLLQIPYIKIYHKHFLIPSRMLSSFSNLHVLYNNKFVTPPSKFGFSQTSRKHFTTENQNNRENDKTSKSGDKSLEGRYATALFNVSMSQGKLETVYSNLQSFQEAISSSTSLSGALLSENFNLTESHKEEFMNTLNTFEWEALSTNFISLLISSKRLYLFNNIFKVFEKLYRSHKGLKHCQITTSKELSNSDKNKVTEAIQKRTGQSFKLLVDFATNSSIMGGILVSVDDQVLDFTVSSRLDRLQHELMEPVSL